MLNNFELVLSHSLTGLEASLFASAGFDLSKELPIAYYRYYTHNKKHVKNRGGGYLKNKTLFCADPIHLEVGLNDITLTQTIDDLTREEAKQCLDALNQHFKQDGLEFLYGSNSQWYLLFSSEHEGTTTPLSEVLRKNIAPFLPQSDGFNWKVIQNEAQMILHALPINQKREIMGLPTLNSLWFYGGGKPEKSAFKLDAVYADSKHKAQMLSKAAACQYYPLPDQFSDLSKTNLKKSLVLLDQLMLPALYDEVEEYQQRLTYLDSLLKPLIVAWEAGKVDLMLDSCTGKLIKPLKTPIWKFWIRSPSSLSEISSEVS